MMSTEGETRAPINDNLHSDMQTLDRRAPNLGHSSCGVRKLTHENHTLPIQLNKPPHILIIWE